MDNKHNRIKAVLSENDLLQTWLAERRGKSFSIVNAFCSNRRQPTLNVLREIAEALNADI